MTNAQHFGQLLRERRKALDLTQNDLAQCVGCSSATIRLVEHGQRKPSRQVAGLLAGCLRIPEAERAEFVALARRGLPTLDEAQIEGASEQAQPIPHNLPSQPTALLGRDKDTESLYNLLLREDVRLLTLTGPPGVGKTRLAIEVVTALVSEDSEQPGNSKFNDGIFWLALASTSGVEMVLPSIARVLGVQDMGTQPVLETVKQFLRKRRTLLLLDNFEHVVQAAPDLAELLGACPNLKMLVTSREALNLRAEREFNVLPLPLPNMADLSGMTPEVLADNPAVALFMERAQAVDRHFSLAGENARVVAAICAQLDGLPLAIELVAARTRMLSPKLLLARLQDTHGQAQLKLLSGGPRDLPGRHKTLSEAIDWSHNLLSNDEQVLFRRLGVFRGGFTLAAAEAVCNARSDLELDLFEGVSQLLHKNLLKLEIQPRENTVANGEARFMILETIHEYARQRLEESSEQDYTRLLHTEYFLAMASNLENITIIGESETAIGHQLDRDYANMRVALTWAIANGRTDMSLQFGLSLSTYWEIRGYFVEGRDWLLRIVSAQTASDQKEAEARAKIARLLLNAGRLSLYIADNSTARCLSEESLALSKELGLEKLAIYSQMNLGHVARFQGDYTSAEAVYTECLRALQRLGNKAGSGTLLWCLGCVTAEVGDFDRSRAMFEESLAVGKEVGDMYLLCHSKRDLGVMLCYKGDYREATQWLEESLALNEQAKFTLGVSWTISALGFAMLGQCDFTRAEMLFRESLSLSRTSDKHRIPDNLEGLAELALFRAEGDTAKDALHRAATLLGAAEAARRLLDVKIIPVRAPVRERLVSQVHLRLGEAEYERAYAVGGTMSLEEAISYA